MPSRFRDDLVHAALHGILGAGSRLPLAVTRPLGPLLTRPLLWALRRERARMRRHLEIAFPELGPGQIRRILGGCASHFGRLLAEIARLSRAPVPEVLAMVQGEGVDHLRAALDRGRGAVIITAHCGNWELLNLWLTASGYPITVAVRELDDPKLDGVVTGLRSRFGTEVVPRSPSAGRQLMRALGRNRGVGLLIDQDIPSIPGVFVPFFGRPAWTPSGAAILALRMRSPMVTAFDHRRPDGSHLIRVSAPLPVPESGSLDERVRELTAAATAAVEWQIRAWPEQWVWMHRRWRTRPEDRSGEESTPVPGDPLREAPAE